MILKSVFVFLLPFCICLEEVPHACLNNTSGNYNCCSDYEEKDGRCVACGAIGFTSIEGQPCRECNGMFYGKRCVTECQCQVYQKCDHIHGCIGDQSLSESTATHSISINSVTPTLPVYTESHLVPTEQPSDRSESVTVYGTAIAGSTESTRNNGFQLELLIYSASVTGVVLILGICYLCKKYNPRRKKSKASVTLDEEITQNDSPNESHEVFELNEGLYHTIDEDKMSITSVNDNPYLEVVNGSSGSDSIENDKGETASYPPPYCRQITTSVDNHPYENSRPESFESHEQISGIQETDRDYLTPNKPTIDRIETEILAMVHVETYSSSGSDNEKNDKNDGIDYLNPYQPLEKSNQNEKDHGYDIPMTGPNKLTIDNVIDQPVELLPNYEKNNTETL